MKINVNYFENNLNLNDNEVLVIEIENKKYFYRFLNDLNKISKGINSDEILFFKNNKELNINNKITIISDYFNLEFNTKKSINDLNKYINENITEENKYILFKNYEKILKTYKKIINDIDIPLLVDETLNIENLTKMVNIKINEKNELLENLLLLIDIEKIMNNSELIIFVNLKQYLNKLELEELYKYAIYNQINILLIDSQCYGTTMNFEKKLIIDDNLEEYML